MKNLQQIIREFEERRERLADAGEAVRQRGRIVTVKREVAAFAELCSQPTASQAASSPRRSTAAGEVPEYAWIRC